jgi:hypothetical protein
MREITDQPVRAPPHGWGMFVLFLYCQLLTTLAAALAAILASWPHWLPALIR